MSFSLHSRAGTSAAAALLIVAMSVGVSACTSETAAGPSSSTTSTPAADHDAVPKGVVDDAFQIGHGPVVVTLFTDASCPHCKKFDAAAGAALQARIDAGEITLRMHPMNYVSAKRGDNSAWSTRAMNLLAAIADSGQLARVPAVYSGILKAQPAEGTNIAMPDDAALLRIAADNGVHVTSAIKTAVKNRSWDAWVQRANDQAIGKAIGDSGVVLQGVPTVLVNDTQLMVQEDGTDLSRLQGLITAAK
jgi:protein-disulfide isomerase